MTRDSAEVMTAPPAEADEKPDSPTDMTKQSWFYILRKTAGEFGKDQCTDLAAALTYYAVLALFPAIIALLSLIGLVGQSDETVATILQIMRDIGAGSIATTLEPTLKSLASSSGAGLALVIGLVAALYSASGYVNSFGRAMNRIYEIGEGRPIWKLRPIMLLVTLVMVLMTALVLVALVLTGPAAEAVGNAIGLGSTAVTVWDIAKWPVVLVVVVLIVAILYWATPNVQQPKFRWMSVGAFTAIFIWILASAGFGFYVSNFSNYNKTYGSLAGIIVFLLWLWLTNIALLFGAELDAEMERARELQAGIAAEESVQLPPRDTTNIKKAEEKHRVDVERGRQLRMTNGRSADTDQEAIDDGFEEFEDQMNHSQDATTSAKILYRPVGIASSVIAGIAAGQLFKLIWKHGTPGPDAEAPDALDSSHRMREVLLAAAAQGAIYAVVKAGTQRGGARWFQRRTGEWPGN